MDDKGNAANKRVEKKIAGTTEREEIIWILRFEDGTMYAKHGTKSDAEQKAAWLEKEKGMKCVEIV